MFLYEVEIIFAMSEITAANIELICPECKANLPDVRSKSPWCECGWSSVTEEWALKNVPPRLRPMLVRDRIRAEKLAKIDKQAVNLFSHPWGKNLWKIYLAITLLFCLPILSIKYILYAIVLMLWGYTVYIQSLILISIMTVGIIGIFTYQWLTRPEKETLGIMLNRQSAPKLFELLDEVAISMNTTAVSIVSLRLDTSSGIRQKLANFLQLHIETELQIGLLDLYAVNISEFKSMITHELGHVKQKDTLLGWLIISNALNTLQNWLSPGPGVMVLLSFLPLYILFWLYFRLLVFLSRWAMRRQEYDADRIAAQVYGRSIIPHALLAICATHIGFTEYVSTIIQQIENNFDRRDFYA
jgi:hypothetical protein